MQFLPQVTSFVPDADAYSSISMDRGENLVSCPALILLSLTIGVQEVSGNWRLRAVSIGFEVASTPPAVRSFGQILPFTGFVLTALGVGSFMARRITLRALRLSALWVALTVQVLQVFAYVSAARWFARDNEKARMLCDYCTAPHPRLFEGPYLAVTGFLAVSILVTAYYLFTTRKDFPSSQLDQS